ncbi:helix-turn-helix domain-containing protein [Actinokineospora xionganensis]|uniref:helix-turn-helix domain-containing protein n=1 Tax=Actinokineospora xionganensis TaxID=2684470 RepID=UPI001FEB24CA|nr:helix-turn-helix transcriptional regulator [Actinokineospora xionganensis]
MRTSEDNADDDVFVAEFKHWRDIAGLSRAATAKLMGFSRSYVSKVESGTEHPSRDFAVAADTALNAGGALRRAWQEMEAGRAAVRRPKPAAFQESADPSTASLVVEHDHAELNYDADRRMYRATMRRRLFNGGEHPITRYLIRISVDRYPGDPERSNQHYRDNPLTWDEIELHAWHGERRADPMHWVPQHDRDAFKEVWLLFANDDGHFPLYPGESTDIEYVYTVAESKWGPWFRRAVRLPTNRLSVTLDFPADHDPAVWGLSTSMTAEAMPFATPIERADHDDRRVFSWTKTRPCPLATDWSGTSAPHAP